MYLLHYLLKNSLEEIYAILNDVVEGNILFQDSNISLQNKKV